MIYVVATLQIELGALEPFVNAACPCIEATRAEPGCIHYDLCASVTDPERVVFVERWNSRAALDAHLASPHMLEFKAVSKPFVKATKIEIVQSEQVEQL
ncbi:antibiotic biosynthesis monooxygenase [Devosia rhodophyticola]|uniref:Antibiotic biosynthesis monooxygenase n=1 Tax=Devosia rhodophyticola TaxID=3026423 RepID=A0ABY7YVK7_9HYPH|nr:antibiotic biosynthesis monooxygenase family protein [Devosia rhodophyticola]WDR05299.1 antibiotic biosynthesis monooxygenase [Devosia rhodophyticola]